MSKNATMLNAPSVDITTYVSLPPRAHGPPLTAARRRWGGLRQLSSQGWHFEAKEDCVDRL